MSTREELVGAVLAQRYEIIAPIGRGGMGVVYSARHQATGRPLAVKVLHPRYAQNRSITERFEREARAASIIEHENIVNIIDVGCTDAGRLFLVMELLKGEDLRQTLVRERRLPWSRVKSIAIQIARALRASHDKGVIHRDLKPENCFRVSRGDNPDFIKILDFGIAKISAPEIIDGRAETTAGTVLGTSRYMAPEQRLGIGVDPRVDIYALGVIIYQLLTGELPIDGPDEARFVASLMADEPLPLLQLAPGGGIPDELEAVVQRALAKRPEQRFPCMAALEEALIACPISEGSRSVSAPPPIAENLSQQPSVDTVAFASTMISAPTPLASPLAPSPDPIEASAQRPDGEEEPVSRRGSLFVSAGTLAVFLTIIGILWRYSHSQSPARTTTPVVVANERDGAGSTTERSETVFGGGASREASTSDVGPGVATESEKTAPDLPSTRPAKESSKSPAKVAKKKPAKRRYFDWRASVKAKCVSNHALVRLEIRFTKNGPIVGKRGALSEKKYSCVKEHMQYLWGSNKRLPTSGKYTIGKV